MCKVHREEPAGGILIFVTGQDEVKRLVAKLGKTFPESVQKSTEIDLDAIEPKVETSSKNNIIEIGMSHRIPILVTLRSTIYNITRPSYNANKF